ncbi:MAG: iron export ABC transporter permease subunit FetB [SAR324 cluster bacterium]|nr:iron export ABC transporter permease subunit FetB [SAR324 cluster bacterium]
MENNYIILGPWQVAAAAALILINILLSIALKLKLEKQLGIASIRMVLQLLLVGFILEWIFTLENFIWILGMALLMASVASISAVNRTRRKFSAIYWNSFFSIISASFLITGIALSGIIQVDPWYHPQYLIPVLGMVLGNTLNGISLTLDRFMEDLSSRRNQIESLLALGATRWEAAHESMKESARAGMIPTINSMMVMGIVSLPGMMTGQILAGANPMNAIYYQIMILFVIAAASALGIIVVILLTFRSLFNSRHQLAIHRLHLK